jgi:hypothetical protein
MTQKITIECTECDPNPVTLEVDKCIIIFWKEGVVHSIVHEIETEDYPDAVDILAISKHKSILKDQQDVSKN